MVLAASCASLPTKTVYTPVHTERKAIIIEPQNAEMSEVEEDLDLGELPDDLSLKDSIKLNKMLIVDRKRLVGKVNDWVELYGWIVRLNPEAENPKTTKEVDP